MMQELESLVEAAGLAPSGDNLQPWRFELDPASGRVTLVLDEARDPSPMNSGQRMARIACGAALENLFRTARRRGLQVRMLPATSANAWCVEVEESRTRGEGGDHALTERVTNRRFYDGRPVPPGTLSMLRALTPALGQVLTCWVTGRAEIELFARLESQAFKHMYGALEMRQAILRNIRFDAPAAARVEEGLSTGSLELNGFQKILLRAMSGMPDWMLRHGGVLNAMAGHVRALGRSASGLCVVLAPNYEDQSDINVGCAMQRAWLALTEQGLAAQPMMTLPVLENVLELGDASLRNRLCVPKIEALLENWPRVIPEARYLRPAFVLRFGYAAAPAGRTGRRPARQISKLVRPDLVPSSVSI